MAEQRVAGIALERRGDGEPLLLLHGTGGSRAHWSPVAGRLAAERTLLIVDLPGHGASDPPPAGVPHTPMTYAELLGGMLDELGLDAVHTAGNSVGGWTALELAKRGRARSVVAIGPAGLWGAGGSPWQSKVQLWTEHKMGRVFAPVMPRVMRSPTGRTLLMSGTVARPREMPAEAAIELASTFASTPTFDTHFAQTTRDHFRGGRDIEAPVTVVWAEKERLIPSSGRRRDELPPHTRYVTLPGCGHVPMWDDPELVARTILEGTA